MSPNSLFPHDHGHEKYAFFGVTVGYKHITHKSKTSNTFQTPVWDTEHQKASIHMQKSQDQRSAQNRFL